MGVMARCRHALLPRDGTDMPGLTRREAELAAETLVEVLRVGGDHLGHVVEVPNDEVARIEWFGRDAPDAELVPLAELCLTRSGRIVVNVYLKPVYSMAPETSMGYPPTNNAQAPRRVAMIEKAFMVTVRIDPVKWAETYGTDLSEVTAEVDRYVDDSMPDALCIAVMNHAWLALAEYGEVSVKAAVSSECGNPC